MLVFNINSISHTRSSQGFVKANETFKSRSSRVEYCYYYFPEAQFCLALKCHQFVFCDTAELTHTLCFCWSLSFLVNLKISKARIQPTPSQGKSTSWILYFKYQNHFLLSKACNLQAIKEDAGHKLLPRGPGYKSVCEELEWGSYRGDAFSWAWYWQNSDMGSASQRALMHRTFIQFYLNKCCIKNKKLVVIPKLWY